MKYCKAVQAISVNRLGSAATLAYADKLGYVAVVDGANTVSLYAVGGQPTKIASVTPPPANLDFASWGTCAGSNDAVAVAYGASYNGATRVLRYLQVWRQGTWSAPLLLADISAQTGYYASEKSRLVWADGAWIVSTRVWKDGRSQIQFDKIAADGSARLAPSIYWDMPMGASLVANGATVVAAGMNLIGNERSVHVATIDAASFAPVDAQRVDDGRDAWVDTPTAGLNGNAVEVLWYGNGGNTIYSRTNLGPIVARHTKGGELSAGPDSRVIVSKDIASGLCALVNDEPTQLTPWDGLVHEYRASAASNGFDWMACATLADTTVFWRLVLTDEKPAPIVLPPQPKPDTFGPVSDLVPDGTAYRMADFVFGAQDFARTKDHDMAQVTRPEGRYLIKFGRGGAYELWAADAAGNVHHLEDMSAVDQGISQHFTHTVWFLATMKIGRLYGYTAPPHESVFVDVATKRELRREPFAREMWLWQGYERFDCGPDLGVRRVLIFVYDNTGGAHTPIEVTDPKQMRAIELFYFAEGAGWIGWEAHHSGRVYQTTTARFDDYSRLARSMFYRAGGKLVQPVPTGLATMTTTVPPPPPPAFGLKKPEVTVTAWTLNEMKNGREFAIVDRENPGFSARVWTENGSMYFSFTNPVGTGRTGLARRIIECGVTEPPPPPGMTLAQATVLVNAAYQELLFRAPDPFGLDYYTSRLMDGRMTDATMRTDIMASAEYKAKHPPPPPPIPPGGERPDMHAWPKFGGSYATGPWRRDYDPALFASLNRDAGGNLTRYWLLDAWGVAPNGPGQHAGIQPWLRDSAGVFDLEKPNYEWDQRLHDCVLIQNNAGATVQVSILNLYSWSSRTEGRQWVPDPNLGPFRRNRNGVSWSGDETLEVLPDWVLKQLITRACVALKGLAVCFEPGNEMPEKDMHTRINDWLRGHFTADWKPYVGVNRQEDTPGQYFNMGIGARYELIAYHGKDRLAYLDEVDTDEPSHRPNTFRRLWTESFQEGRVDPKRIIMSSDGCRKSGGQIEDCYEWDVLAEVVKDHLRRGFSFEHQSRIKMRPFLENRLDLNDFEGHWLRRLRA